MGNTTNVVKFFNAKEIEDKRCDMEKPFAFISYSHEDNNAQKVMAIFKGLYEKGINLWIDVANLPHGGEYWMKAALAELNSENCKILIFFRSETSICSSNVFDELTTFKFKNIENIRVIDIWEQRENNAEKVREDLLKSGKHDKHEIYKKICNIISTECNSYRLAEDYSNDIHQLCDALEKNLKKNDGKLFANATINVTTNVTNCSTARNNTINVTNNDNSFVFKLWGIEYTAHNLADMMKKTFQLVKEYYPGKIAGAAASDEIKFVATKADVDGGKLSSIDYFSARGEYKINGTEYYVGTKFNREAGIEQIKKLISFCDEKSSDGFKLISAPEKKRKI